MQKHHLEQLPSDLKRLFCKKGISNLKIDLWNEFVDSDLIGICDDDCSVLPRILPASYIPTIRRTCRDLTEFLMRILSLPTREIEAIIPSTPVVDYLIDELGILKHRSRRITGSLRYDMAIVGTPLPNNPPKILEVNEIGFDGTGRSSYIQDTILRIFPELKKRVRCFDTAASETRNMRRLGRRFARLQYDCYNWEEEVLLMRSRKVGLDMQLISPTAFDIDIDEECERLEQKRVHLSGGKIRIGTEKWTPSAVQVAYSFELRDYEEAPKLFRDIIRSKTPQYSPFITGLIAPKTILVLLNDKTLRRKLLGSARNRRLDTTILNSELLAGNEANAIKNSSKRVLKHADGMGGELVYVGRDMLRKIKHIPKRKRAEWVLQDRIRLNTIEVDGFLSRRRKVIADLGTYIHYDWNGHKFTNFSVGGFITRATNRSLKVNVSGGGIQVPVMFDRNR